MKKTLVTLLAAAAAAALLLVMAAPALAYPRVLLTAVEQVYAPHKTHVDGLCHEKIGHSTYTRVDVTLRSSDRPSKVAFQWRSGWRLIWKDGKLVRSVPKRQRPHFRWIMRELQHFCH